MWLFRRRTVMTQHVRPLAATALAVYVTVSQTTDAFRNLNSVRSN